MTKPSLEAGSFVQAYCTRCKAMLRHTVVALAEGRPVRVKCNTCGSEHAFKAEEPKQGAAERRSPAEATAEASWKEQLVAAAGRGSKGRPYSVSEGFKAGDVLDHPSYGVGVVQRAVGPGKVLVLFKEGVRTLLCRSST